MSPIRKSFAPVVDPMLVVLPFPDNLLQEVSAAIPFINNAPDARVAATEARPESIKTKSVPSCGIAVNSTEAAATVRVLVSISFTLLLRTN
jgi:hypothetical protein